jgi:hypothetical protein
VALGNFIGVDNDAVVQELSEDEIVSDILMERNGPSGNVTLEGEEEDDSGNNKNIITVAEAASMGQYLQFFIMTRKDILDRVLESSDILQEFTEKLLLKQAVLKRITFLWGKKKFFFFFFYMCRTIILTF